MKLKLNGDCDHFCIDNILGGLKLTLDQFLRMCILTGCDYLENVKGIGINRAFALISADNLFKILAEKGASADYEKKFEKAIAVFNHQTVFDIATMKCISLTDWEESHSNEMQNYCGAYPCPTIIIVVINKITIFRNLLII